MAAVRLTVLESDCRAGYHRAGEGFLVEDLCPPLCQELWHCAYPYVFALRSGGVLDCGAETARSFEVRCPDGGRVLLRGELVEP